MSALDDRWAEVDPDALGAEALEAPRCTCERPILDGWGSCVCGRERRAEGAPSRGFRRAAYSRRLQWARGSGLDSRTGFRGLSDEVGPNPDLPALDANLAARAEALLSPSEDDPFEGVLRSWRTRRSL